MVNHFYIPDGGDVIYLTFDQGRGHEQRGRRPAVVLTSRKYNELIGLALVCPVTSKIKGYVFEVPCVLRNKASVVLCDHVKSVAWREHNPVFIDMVESSVLAETIRKIVLLLTN